MKRRSSPPQAALIGAALAGVVAILLGSIVAAGQSPAPGKAAVALPKDPVAFLEEQIQRREVKLDYEKGGLGFLPSLLTHLGVNVDSQLLVFSKTSFHADLIGPAAPRAVYFNDNVFIGFTRHGDLELAALDPAQGIAFYTLEATPAREPRFLHRDAECSACHGLRGSSSLITQSVFPDSDGNALFLPGITPPAPDHTTPFEQRWGGWYVTGTHGSQRHMGNAVVPDPYRSPDLEQEGTQNLTSLKTKVNLSSYLAQTSDLVALMTFEHQLRMSNLIARISRQAREVERSSDVEGAATDTLKAGIEQMLQYMLFVEEAPLHEPIRGVSSFTATFPSRGPRDSQGRSLRDFDLQTRIFRYPLSYMIYSEAFDAIPDSAKAQIYKRLYDILTNRDTSKEFARSSTADRKAIFEILRATKLNLPEYWETP
jgi:hypothetical protein